MMYQVEIDDRDETAKAVLSFIRQIAQTNKAVKVPVAVTDEQQPVSQAGHKLTERPFGTMKGSFRVSPDFNEPLDELNEYM